MAKQKILYAGTAAGQSSCIRIGGQLFTRGETYNVDDVLAERLLARGGFSVVKPPVKKALVKKEIEEKEL
jgi:hypothetical protein